MQRSLALGCGMSFLLLYVACVLGQDAPSSALRAYRQAAGAVLTTYVQEQRSWNHYFTRVAPQQKVGDQIPPQNAYRRFLATTLTQWRQISVPLPCEGTHALYEQALLAYGVAADFHLIFLQASRALFSVRAVREFAAERTQHYTALGDTYFRQAAQHAQASGCVPSATPG